MIDRHNLPLLHGCRGKDCGDQEGAVQNSELIVVVSTGESKGDPIPQQHNPLVSTCWRLGERHKNDEAHESLPGRETSEDVQYLAVEETECRLAVSNLPPAHHQDFAHHLPGHRRSGWMTAIAPV